MEVNEKSKLEYIVSPKGWLYWVVAAIVIIGGIVMFTVNGLVGVIVCNLCWIAVAYQQKVPKDVRNYARRIDDTGTYGTICVYKTERLLSASSKTFELFDSLVR